MNHLIPLLIAIILGGMITVLSAVLIGPQFSDRSSDIMAQQFATAGSSIESSLRVFKTQNAISAFDTDFATTMVDATNNDGLVDLGYLTQIPVAPQGAYAFEQGANNELYLVATGADISFEVCKSVVELDDGQQPASFTVAAKGADRDADMSGSRLHCVEDGVSSEYELVFRVE